MKTSIPSLLLPVLLASGLLAQAQNSRSAVRIGSPGGLPGPRQEASSAWQTFDIDFPGGTPGELVAQISEASGQFVNVLVPKEHGDVRIPAFSMRGVTVPQVFQALATASQQEVKVRVGAMTSRTGQVQYQWKSQTSSYGFETEGLPTPNSVWVFFNTEPAGFSEEEIQIPQMCRFYHLEKELGTYKIDDIITAVQTGWDLLHVEETARPRFKFHEETKLLIAVGQTEHLKMIDEVLEELLKGLPKSRNYDEPAR